MKLKPDGTQQRDGTDACAAALAALTKSTPPFTQTCVSAAVSPHTRTLIDLMTQPPTHGRRA